VRGSVLSPAIRKAPESESTQAYQTRLRKNPRDTHTPANPGALRKTNWSGGHITPRQGTGILTSNQSYRWEYFNKRSPNLAGWELRWRAWEFLPGWDSRRPSLKDRLILQGHPPE
jgi:hypothetical protein